jgi:lipopolysaccharide export system protein LptC
MRRLPLPRLPDWWWNQLSLYLPVVLMGLLALGSYWVVSQSPKPSEPRPERPVSKAPDYFMQDFAIRTFGPQGELRSEIQGNALRHYPANQTVEVDGARLRMVNAQGRVTTAVAERLETDDAQSFYTLSGGVVVVREALTRPGQARWPRLEFKGERITYEVASGVLSSDLPVQMTRDRHRMQADTLRYSEDSRQALLQGRVRATLSARP